MSKQYIAYTFRLSPEKTHYQLVETKAGNHYGTNLTIRVVEQWPKRSYSKEKAMGRADRIVGRELRQADPDTRLNYMQDIALVQEGSFR